jgi:hypothetical protein
MWQRLLLIVGVIFLTLGLCSCSISADSAEQALPFISPAYYNCSVTDPETLFDAYHSRYANVSMASTQFDNTYFVFKNIQLTAISFKHLDQGYFWLAPGQIKCYPLHPSDIQHLKAGDVVDVVGLNYGIALNDASLAYKDCIVFKDCIVLPAGSVMLPAPGVGGLTIPGGY